MQRPRCSGRQLVQIFPAFIHLLRRQLSLSLHWLQSDAGLPSVTSFLPSYSLIAVESLESYAVVTVASLEFITFQGSMSKCSKDVGKGVCKESSQKLVKKVRKKSSKELARKYERKVQYPSDARYKVFHMRARSHEKRIACVVGVKRVRATNNTRLLLVRIAFSWMSKRICSSCETCSRRVSLACETRSSCRKLVKRVLRMIQRVC